MSRSTTQTLQTITKMAPNTSPLVARQDKLHSARREADEEANGDRPKSDLVNDPFARICFNIALYLTHKRVGKGNTHCKYGVKMEELTKNMLVKHEMAFRGMTERLQLNPHNIVESFEAVARETFIDGCNFGRVVATYAFFLTVLDYCLRHNMENKISELQLSTTNIISDHKEWINKNGGWVRACFKRRNFEWHILTTAG